MKKSFLSVVIGVNGAKKILINFIAFDVDENLLQYFLPRHMYVLSGPEII